MSILEFGRSPANACTYEDKRGKMSILEFGRSPANACTYEDERGKMSILEFGRSSANRVHIFIIQCKICSLRLEQFLGANFNEHPEHTAFASP